jgi:hypothetical protein
MEPNSPDQPEAQPDALTLARLAAQPRFAKIKTAEGAVEAALVMIDAARAALDAKSKPLNVTEQCQRDFWRGLQARLDDTEAGTQSRKTLDDFLAKVVKGKGTAERKARLQACMADFYKAYHTPKPGIVVISDRTPEENEALDAKNAADFAVKTLGEIETKRFGDCESWHKVFAALPRNLDNATACQDEWGFWEARFKDYWKRHKSNQATNAARQRKKGAS